MYDAIVLAGGSGRRLGGLDKASLVVGGRSLLVRVLHAVAGANRKVVVGPARDLPDGVVRTSEQPPGGGPVAGLAAGLELVEAPLVVVLACDLPFVTIETIRTLIDPLVADQAQHADGAQLVDDAGFGQPLTAVYRTARLRAALSGFDRLANRPMRDLLDLLGMLGVEAAPGQAWDCDSWADVERARGRADTQYVEEA